MKLFMLASFFSTVILGDVQECSVMCKRIPDSTNPKDVLLFYGNSNTHQSIPSDFELLTWNIYKGKREPLFETYKRITQNTDIVMLQEMLSSPKLENFFLSLGTQYFFSLATSFILDSNFATGVLTGGKAYPSKISYSISEGREPIIGTPKAIGIHYYRITDSAQELMVLNIHGINVTKASWLLKQLEGVEPYLNNHQGPIVFAGDFNTKNQERMNIVFNFMKKNGLKSVDWENPEAGHFENEPTKFLDHTFVRNLQIKKAKFLQEYESADHPAMLIQASINH